MNGGVAKDIKEKWPEVFNQYKKVVDSAMDKSKLLGTCQVCMTEDGKYIVSSIIEEAFRDCHIMLAFWTLASDNYRTIYNS